MFSKEARAIIKKSLRENLRWKDPQKVMDRLNSPEVFEHWFVNNFRYDWSKFHIGKRNAYPQPVKQSIRRKKGICFDAAYLAYACLKKAGYDVTGLNVYFRGRAASRAIMHSVCLIKMGEHKFYIVGDTNFPGGMSGPFKSIKAAAERIAIYHRVPLGTYTTGLPAYHRDLWPG